MSIEMFDFKGHDVRVVLDDQGESRWVASDVASVLGYRMASDMTRHLDSDEISAEKVKVDPTQNRTSLVRRMNVITESGLYMAIMKSERPEAKDFRRWVTREVLPSIRKHGGYISEHATEEQVEALQRELSKTKDQLTEAVRREDSSYGRWQSAQRELDSLKLVDEIREHQDRAVNVYEYIVRRTGDHSFASKWTIQLAKATGREWPHVFSDGDGIRANPSDLDDAWLRYGYGSEAIAHKLVRMPSVLEALERQFTE